MTPFVQRDVHLLPRSRCISSQEPWKNPPRMSPMTLRTGTARWDAGGTNRGSEPRGACTLSWPCSLSERASSRRLGPSSERGPLFGGAGSLRDTESGSFPGAVDHTAPSGHAGDRRPERFPHASTDVPGALKPEPGGWPSRCPPVGGRTCLRGCTPRPARPRAAPA